MRNRRNFRGPKKWVYYIIARAFITLIQRLPIRLVYRFGRFIGYCLYFILKKRRISVRDNLLAIQKWAKGRIVSTSIDAIKEMDIERQSKEVFMRSAANLLSGIVFVHLPADRVPEHLEIEGFEVLEAALSEKKGMIALLAHMGPWEALAHLPCIAAECNIQNSFGALYRPLNNDYLDEWFKLQRQARGTSLFSRRDGFHKPIQFLRNGGMLGILSDQKMRQGNRVDFFGCSVSTTPIPGLFHRKTGAPMISVSLSTVGSARWRMRFRRVDLASLAKVSTREEGCRLCNKALEVSLSDSVLDGFWFQKRLKIS